MSAPTTSDCNQDAARAHGSSLQRMVSPRQFHPPLRGTNRNQIHNESRCESAAVGAVSGRTVPDEDGNALLTSRKSSIETERGGKLYRKPYHDQLDALRRDPENCGRCGKPSANGKRQCDKCREYQHRYKAKARGENFDAQTAAGMIVQMRRELSRLRATVKNMANNRRKSYSKGYSKGFETGKTTAKYADTLPEISKQELATMNHAYDHDQD